MSQGLFVSATGTGVGKTWVTRGLARALVRRGTSVAAIKPVETGCNPDPLDAMALARACARPELATADGLYRAAAPLAPHAVTLGGGARPDLDALVRSTRTASADADVALVEGAGGLLVPLDETHTFADFAQRLGLPVLLVTRDGLGVLSHTLTACESADRRGLSPVAIVLVRHAPTEDPSIESNARILDERLPCPVLTFPTTADEDEALAAAAEAAELLALLD